MKYYVTIDGTEYEVSMKGAGGQTYSSVLLDGEQFAINFWRVPESPFVSSS